MEFLNVSRQRAAEPYATGRTRSKAAGFVTKGGCWERAGDKAALKLPRAPAALQGWFKLCFTPLPYGWESAHIRYA